MHRLSVFGFAAALVSGAGPAVAAHMPDFMPAFPIEHVTDARTAPQPQSPYPMNYADEVAQAMGVRAGRVDLFDSGPSDNSFIPAFKGGIDRGGAMFRLQWHPGE
jgi:hypothetical protein